MAGRGRGRGRGIVKETTNPPPRPGGDRTTSNGQAPDTNVKKELVQAAPKTDELDDLKKIINSIDPSSEEKLDAFAKKAQGFGTSDEKCLQLTDYMYLKTFEDNDFSRKAAVCMNRLQLLEGVGLKFRSSLLKRAQEHYKNRESLRARSLGDFTGLVHVICEIFKVLRIGGIPLKPLASSIYQMFNELLQGVKDGSDNEGCQLECVYTQFKNIGEMLEAIDQQKMDDLMCQIRDTIVSGSSSQQERCLLTEVLELKASKWQLTQAVQNFYCDAMADLMASQG